MKTWVALVATFLFPLSGLCENGKVALVFGGSGDDPGSDTTFDKAASIYLNRLKSGGYEISANFSGRRPDTLEVFRQAGVPRTDATLPNVRASVQELAEKIRQGKVKQAVIYVDSHGKPRREGQISHPVFLEDGKFDMDELKPVRDAAEAAGVPLVIIDGSCYAGATLALAGTKTCALSFTSQETEGWGHYSADFAKELKSGKTMEKVFLDMMDNSISLPSIPRISTESGQLTAEALKFLEINTLANQDDLHASLQPDRTSSLAHRGSDFKALNAQFLNSLKDMKLGLTPQELKQINQALEEYQSAYLDLREAVKDLPKRPEKPWPLPPNGPCARQSGTLPLAPGLLAEQVSKLTEDPLKEYRKSLEPKELLLARLATEVTKIYKALYPKVYRLQQKKTATRPQEACARFVL